MKAQIVLIDDEPHMRAAAQQTLELAGFPDVEIKTFDGADAALTELSTDFFGIIISDIKMPGMDGLAFLNHVRRIDPELPVILVTGHGDVAMALKAVRDGAYDFIEKPYPTALLVESARRGLERRRLVLENRSLRRRLSSRDVADVVVGGSQATERLRRTIVAFAAVDANVLILGETGAGKELVARTVHALSPRRGQRFVAINCGALPQTMIESELFGHEAGAFTGAVKRRVGKFEYAQGGTLLLDEIESMPLDLQVRLLRVLQERSIERLGSNDPVPLDVRVIAATKTDLLQSAQRGTFREDLYFRLSVMTINVPPLRERMSDVALLFRVFAAQAATPAGAPVVDLDADTLAALLQHDWPGNVRELQNAAFRFVHGLGVNLQPHQPATGAAPVASLSDRMALIESELIRLELARQQGNLKATYESLGIARKTLYDKMQRYGLGKPHDESS
jgi:two-component system, NtrC family, C4-dicarboxylate transport response regulator DctD